ncbi:MAG: hypothetical protein P8Y08_08975 [Desulfobulbaceae bacterium]
MDDLKNSLGFRYLQETKFDAQTLWHKPRLDITPAQTYKQYAEAEKIKLPTDWEMDKSLHEALQSRRSCRRYTDIPLSMENIAMLLWASQGISGRAGNFFSGLHRRQGRSTRWRPIFQYRMSNHYPRVFIIFNRQILAWRG